MAHPESLIFDLDGTLWNTVALCANAWNEATLAHGLEYRQLLPSDLASIMGLVKEDVRKKLFFDLSDEVGQALLDRCFEVEIEHLERAATPPLYSGVREGLESLSEKYRLFLVSNCDVGYLEVFLEKTGFRSLFRDWECHGATGLKKTENIRKVMKRNLVTSAVYVGDTVTDQEAALGAGVPFAFVSYGFGRADRVPDFSFDRFLDLVSFFLR